MDKKKNVKPEYSSEKKGVGKKQVVAKPIAVKTDIKSAKVIKPIVAKSKTVVKPAVTKPVESKFKIVKSAPVVKSTARKSAVVKSEVIKFVDVKNPKTKPANAVRPAEAVPPEAPESKPVDVEVNAAVFEPATVKPADVKPEEAKPSEVAKPDVVVKSPDRIIDKILKLRAPKAQTSVEKAAPEQKNPEDIIAEFPAEMGPESGPPDVDLPQADKTEIVPLEFKNSEVNDENKKAKESPVPGPDGNPIVDLKRIAFAPDYTLSIKIYENGLVEYNKHSVESGFNDNKEFSVRPEETKFYADKLIELGFLGFKKNYKQEEYVHDGFYDCTTLNYKGNKKTINCTSKEPDFEKYYSLVSNLIDLNFNNIRKKIKLNINMNKVSKIVTGIAVLLLIAFLILSIQPKYTKEIYEPRTISHAVPETKPVPLSIAELAGITRSGYEENVSVLVFLRKEEVQVSNEVISIYQYVADDYNNKILVSINGIQKNAAYGPLFTESLQTFRVTGILKNTYKGLVLEVNTIVPEERKYDITENVATETVVQSRNVTVPAKLNLSFGLKRIKDFLS